MRNLLLLLITFSLINKGHGNSSVSDSELQDVSEIFYSLDFNRASDSQLIINPQTLIQQSESGHDLSPQPLYVYVDEVSLFSRSSYSALIALLDNYERKTGVTESFSSSELQEQENFLTETMQNTPLGRELYSFLCMKGYYSSWAEFLYDLRMMWFGLYSRSSNRLDSSGFEHIFAGEVKNGKVSGFHNWVRFYLLEKSKLINYYSHSYDGPWTSYPDVLGLQFMWDGYYKPVGSALIGSSPELDLAVYTLCYITRPGKHCRLSLGGKVLTIQTHTWDKTTYGDGKKFIASAYPVTP